VSAPTVSSADLFRAPIAMIDRGLSVIVVAAPAGLGGSSLEPVVDRLCELGALTLITGEAHGVAGGTMDLPLDDPVTEALSPVLTILPLQLLAGHLARERRIDRDHPRRSPRQTNPA
jgi:glutamine---fructose-6-phosphate transaminase (isomerizing)